MDLAPASSHPEPAYHDQTQLLVFKGSPDPRALIASVLARYEQSWRPASARAEALRHELADVELQMLTSQIEAESTMRRADVAERRHNELRELMNAGAVSGSEYAQSLVALDEARARVKILNAHSEHARRRHSDLARALAAVTQGQEPTPVIYDIRGLGQRGERTAAAFRDLVHAAQLPGTSLTVDGSGTLTLTARPPLQRPCGPSSIVRAAPLRSPRAGVPVQNRDPNRADRTVRTTPVPCPLASPHPQPPPPIRGWSARPPGPPIRMATPRAALSIMRATPIPRQFPRQLPRPTRRPTTPSSPVSAPGSAAAIEPPLQPSTRPGSTAATPWPARSQVATSPSASTSSRRPCSASLAASRPWSASATWLGGWSGPSTPARSTSSAASPARNAARAPPPDNPYRPQRPHSTPPSGSPPRSANSTPRNTPCSRSATDVEPHSKWSARPRASQPTRPTAGCDGSWAGSDLPCPPAALPTL